MPVTSSYNNSKKGSFDFGAAIIGNHRSFDFKDVDLKQMIASVRKAKSKIKRDLNKTELFSPQNSNNPRTFLNTQEWRIARPCRLLASQNQDEYQMLVSKKRNTLAGGGKMSVLSSSLQVPKDRGLANHANMTMMAGGGPKMFHQSSEESQSML